MIATIAILAASCEPGRAALPTEAPPPAVGPKAAAVPSLKPGRAVLVEGARAVRGLPGFGRNALPALEGGYAYLAGGSGDRPVRLAVWFTREPLLYPADWSAEACDGLAPGWSARAAPAEADGSSLWAFSSGASTLLVRWPAGQERPCRFAAALVDRFSFFLRYAERPEDVSFPAVLEVGR